MSLLAETLTAIEPQDKVWREQARARLDRLAIPHWSLGRLLDLALDLAGITRSMNPQTARRCAIVCAGDHGVVAEGVSAFPQEVTAQMVRNFVRGGASINALAKTVNARVLVADFGVAADLDDCAGALIDKKVAPGTRNMATGPAMSREQAVRAIEGGIEIAAGLAAETDIFCTGDMGIGNTTPSAAVCAVLCGRAAAEITGPGTGIDSAALRHKVSVIERALALNKPDKNDALDVLAKVGGFEIGGIAGIILGAARARRPVVIDGFISTAGALLAQGLCPASADYMVAAHRSREPGHIAMLERLGKEPLLDLQMRLGEGTGAVLALPVLEAARAALCDIMTFAEAGVSSSD